MNPESPGNLRPRRVRRSSESAKLFIPADVRPAKPKSECKEGICHIAWKPGQAAGNQTIAASMSASQE